MLVVGNWRGRGEGGMDGGKEGACGIELLTRVIGFWFLQTDVTRRGESGGGGQEGSFPPFSRVCPWSCWLLLPMADIVGLADLIAPRGRIVLQGKQFNRDISTYVD